MNEGVPDKYMRIQTILQSRAVYLLTQIRSPQLATYLEQEREGEVVRCLSNLKHSLVEAKSFFWAVGIAKASDHGVPEEPIWGFNLLEDREGIIHRTLFRIKCAKGDELGHDEDVLVETGMDDLGMDLFKVFDGRTWVEEGEKLFFFFRRIAATAAAVILWIY